MAKRPNTADVEDTSGQAIDDAADAGQSLRSGPVEDGQAFIEGVAKRAGWTPKEEWKRDPDKWVDAAGYLEKTPEQVSSLKERLARTAQAAADAIEDQRRQARIEAQAEIRAAAEAKDPEAAAAAAEKLAKVSGPPPQTVAWLSRNPWFDEDADAQVLAIAEVNRVAAQGGTIEDQLKAAEAKVRKRFPEHFGEVKPDREEVSLRESNVKPPAVQSGTRGGNSTPKVKGFNDIPAGDRALYQKHFARRYEQTMKAEDAQKKYANAYWANKGE